MGVSHIHLIKGDITRAKVDMVVNAANPTMLGGGGVDGAIHRAAGPALLAACYQIPAINGIRCPVGEARITVAGELPAKFVVHTAGPVYYEDSQPAEHLRACYRNVLSLARRNGAKTIAFPAISCGVYGYPYHEAAMIALSVCQTEKKLEIFFYLLDEDIFNDWQQALAKIA